MKRTRNPTLLPHVCPHVTLTSIRFIQGAAFACLLGASGARAVTLHLNVKHGANGAPLILVSRR
jgi:hypothetical protein